MSDAQPDFTFTYNAAQRERFRTGGLAKQWRKQYPNIFDDKDIELLTTAHQRKYHFFEWLSAILLFEATGYLSLVESYTSKTHPEKRMVLESQVGPAVFKWLNEHQSGQPDLFVYRREPKGWFFCEVKGAADRVRKNQREWFGGFRLLQREHGITGERIRVLQLREVDFD